MKKETLEVLTAPAPNLRQREIKRMAELIVSDAKCGLSPIEATSRAWYAMCINMRHGALADEPMLTYRGVHAMVHTIAECALHLQEAKK